MNSFSSHFSEYALTGSNDSSVREGLFASIMEKFGWEYEDTYDFHRVIEENNLYDFIVENLNGIFQNHGLNNNKIVFYYNEMDESIVCEIWTSYSPKKASKLLSELIDTSTFHNDMYNFSYDFKYE